MTRAIVLASNNAGKLKEFGQLLAPIGFSLHPQGEFEVPEADEPHCTFVENALAKARHAASADRAAGAGGRFRRVRQCLGGAPGVHSARYAGEPKSDARNNREADRRPGGAMPTNRPTIIACWSTCAMPTIRSR